ncbi:type 2 lanthipeptide synthetase LanM family protein [Bacillus cereus group sp. MYBK226-2]|uniref:type 2 lanthipeptide synthetase LanM family protein n=1 Tax=Bacillus cereus group sp. MYBK226-2 TaxID=3450655 RepID=UPI003F7A60F3
MENLKVIPWKVFSRSAYLAEILVNNSCKEDNNEVLENWLKRTGFNTETLNYQLEYLGFTKEMLQSILLSKKNNEFPNTKKLEWIEQLKEIFSIPQSFVTSNKTAFECLLEPFIIYASQKINHYFSINKSYKRVMDEQSISKSIIENLKTQLSPITVKPIVLEVNIAELRKELQGQTPEEKFEFFLKNKLSSSQQVLNLLLDYPVLARRLTEILETSLHHQFKILDRFFNDYKEIYKTILPSPSILIQLHIGAGDTHNGGQTVTILTFKNQKKLVYKPRSLSIDLKFQKFLGWCNQTEGKVVFSTLNVIDKEKYGWQEFISHTECKNEEEIRLFYTRLGGYLAILYAFNAVDFHFENLIAHGAHPYLIDLESICYPLQPMSEQNTAQHEAIKLLMKSVLGTGLLPIKYKPNDSLDVEVSGIGGSAGQQIGNVETLKGNNTSGISIEKVQSYSTSKENRPKFNGQIIDPTLYILDILEGFEGIYRIFLEHKEQLLKNDGILKDFSTEKIRFVAKNTHVYGEFLRKSEHTDYLQHGLDRQRLFDLFWNYGSVSAKHLPIIASEIEDLLQGDVPYFSTKINSKSIWNSKGEEIPDFLEVSGWELIYKKVNTLSLQDLKQQRKWISMSIATLSDEEVQCNNTEIKNLGKENECPITLATKIGEYISSEAVWGHNKKDVTWIGVGMDEREKVSLSPLSVGLYDGLVGISLFFANLYKVTNKEEFKELSRAALNSVMEDIKHPTYKLSLSGYHGYGSILYGLIEISHIQGYSNLENEIKMLLNKIDPLISNDEVYDVIGGVAGTLMVLVKYYEVNPSKEVIDIAKRCGNHLVKNCLKLDKGLAWKSKNSETVLGGFSHGVIGIALALYRLFKITHEKVYLNTCLEAIRYQDSLFNNKTNLWGDSTENERVDQRLGWCHGSSGIIIAYIEMWDILNSDQKEMVQKSIDTTLDNMGYNNHSLCHGALGNYWALTHTEKIYEKVDYRISNIKNKLLKEIATNPIISGFPGKMETPNLMLGLSGIGLSLLAMERDISNILILK